VFLFELLNYSDILSLLLFNTSFEELSLSFRRNVEDELRTAATGVVTGMVSQQLSKSIGKSLNLDVIEFSSGQELAEGSLLVGKYITDDIFVSFGQDFSSFSSADALRVALEYEIARSLFLQGAKGGRQEKETGFDLIWKWEW